MNRNGLLKHVGDWITRLGSQSKVAEKCGISGTALSQWMNGKYGANSAELEKRIASTLGYQEDGWQVVTTIQNYRKIEFVYRSCKQQALWMAISNKAGSGKTQTLEHLFNQDLTGSVVFIQAEEWNSRQFLVELAERTCGVPKRGYTDIPTLLKMIAEYFNGMAGDHPVHPRFQGGVLGLEPARVHRTGRLPQADPPLQPYRAPFGLCACRYGEPA